MKQKLPLQLRKKERRKGRRLCSIQALYQKPLSLAVVFLFIFFNQSRGAEDSTATFLFKEIQKEIDSGNLNDAYADLLELNQKFMDAEDSINISRTRLKMGRVKDMLGEHKKAREYFRESQTFSNRDKPEILSDAYNGLACSYYLEERFDSATWFFDKAYEVLENSGDEDRMMLHNFNKGSLMIGNEDYLGAIDSYLQVVQYSDSSLAAAASLNLGVAFMNVDNYDSASMFLNRTLEYAKKLHNTEYSIYALRNLGDLNYNMGKFQKACDTYESYNLLKDSLYSANVSLEIAQLEQQYALAKDKLALKESELATITWQRWAIAIGALFILGIVLGFGAYRRRVAVQQARTQAVLETREDETKRITDLLWSEIGASTKDGKLSLPGQELPEHTIPGAIAAARFLSSQQYNPYLQLGLKRAVDHLLSTLNKGKDAQVGQELEEIDIDKAERLAYYRMLENILVQVFSRANTTTISVQLAKQKNNLVFEVTANEILDPTNKRFQSAEARVQQFKGKMKFEESDNSTTIKVDVPIA